MGLNKHLQLEIADLEIAIEELLSELGIMELTDLDGRPLSRAERKQVKQLEELQRELAEAEDLRRRYNERLGELSPN